MPIFMGHLIGMVRKPSPTNSILNIEFYSENGKQAISLKPEYFLFLKSVDNYVEVYYRNDQGIKKQLLRNTLKHIEQQYHQSPYVKRCHRGYLVNPTNVQVSNLVGANSLKLLIDQFEVPVSVKYLKDFQ